MRERNLKIVNFILHLLFLALIAGVQTSLWPEIFGTLPAPLSWGIILAYFSFFRTIGVGLLYVYVSSLIITGFTGTGLGMILGLQMAVFMSAYFFKARVLWSGLTYQLILGGLTVLLFESLSFFMSWIFEINTISHFSFWHFLFQLVITTLLTPGILWVIRQIDNWTETDLTLIPGAREL